MLCVAAALWFLGQRRYWAAAAVSGLSTGLRPTGVALAAVVILMALRQTATLPPARRWTTLLGISALSVAGLMAYQGFLMVRYHRVDGYFVAQRDWQPAQQEAAIPKAEVQTNAEGSNSQLTAEHSSSREGPVAGVLRRLTSPGAWNRVLLAGVVGLGVWGLVRPGTLPRELFVLPIFIFLLGWLPGWGARITSIARFETAAIPCFVLLAQVLQTRPAWAWAVLGSTLALQCGVYAVQIARGVWGG